VDAAHQIIVSQRLVTTAADYGGPGSAGAAAHATLKCKPREVSADTGCATEANLAAMAERRIAAYPAARPQPPRQ
jgi:hypothetical protein